MIKVVAKCWIYEDSIEAFKAGTDELIEKSREEDGCISYRLYQDINDASIFTFIEEWSDTDALDLHTKSDHFTEIVPKLNAYHKKDSELNIYSLIN